ncbi:hypothetical protein D3C84_751420 [compost metagenome]
MDPGQARQQAAHEAGIVPHPDTAVSMHHRIVPGRHLLVMCLLARIPAGGDIAVDRLEDHQHLVPLLHLLPERVVARHMGAQDAMFPLPGIELERQVIGIQPLLAMGDQGPQRMGSNKLMQRLGIGGGEMGW